MATQVDDVDVTASLPAQADEAARLQRRYIGQPYPIDRNLPMLIHGRCHCGNIAFTLDWTPEPVAIAARACTCTFCTKHGGVWTACADGSLEVTVADSARVSMYAFETKTADFYICTSCGVVPLATSRIDDRLYAVVNVNTFEGLDPSLLSQSPSTLDGETEAGRLARRKRNWIAQVAIRH